MEEYQIQQLKDIKTWTDQDSHMAMFEGWCITNTSKENIYIAKLDLAGKFENDEDAAIFVMDQFLKGNGLAAKAIYYLLTAHYELDHPNGW